MQLHVVLLTFQNSNENLFQEDHFLFERIFIPLRSNDFQFSPLLLKYEGAYRQGKNYDIVKTFLDSLPKKENIMYVFVIQGHGMPIGNNGAFSIQIDSDGSNKGLDGNSIFKMIEGFLSVNNVALILNGCYLNPKGVVDIKMDIKGINVLDFATDKTNFDISIVANDFKTLISEDIVYSESDEQINGTSEIEIQKKSLNVPPVEGETKQQPVADFGCYSLKKEGFPDLSICAYPTPNGYSKNYKELFVMSMSVNLVLEKYITQFSSFVQFLFALNYEANIGALSNTAYKVLNLIDPGYYPKITIFGNCKFFSPYRNIKFKIV